MTKFWIPLFAIFLFFSSCKSSNQENKMVICAAASTQFAVEKLAAEFSKEKNITVDVVFGSSGKITTQIMNGAPYDIFFSANTEFPDLLYKEGKAIDTPYIYGFGIPVIWTMNTDLNLSDAQNLFTNSSIKKIAIADPKNAPYGAQAVAYLKSIGVYESVEKKLVYGESISQVNEYILSQSAQIGFTAKSIVLCNKLKDKGIYRSLEKEFYIEQSMVPLKTKKNDTAKHQFLEYVKSAKGQQILKKYGLK